MKIAKLEADVKAALKKRGEKLYEASQAIGFGKNFLGQLLKGRSPLSERNFIKICKHCKLRPTDYTADGKWHAEVYLPRKGFISDADNQEEVWAYRSTTDHFEILVDERFVADLFGKKNIFVPGCAFRCMKVERITDEYHYLVSNGGRYALVLGSFIKAKQYKYVYEVLSVRGPR